MDSKVTVEWVGVCIGIHLCTLCWHCGTDGCTLCVQCLPGNTLNVHSFQMALICTDAKCD